MPSRRGFLKLLGAGAIAPTLSWADMGGPAYLAAARTPEGAFALFGVDALGRDIFSVALPDRAHAATVHPRLARAVVFARRPGTYAVVLDCATGRQLARMEAPEGLIFCGHGVFDAAGDRLYTSEAVAETGEGRIGVWDMEAGVARVGAVPSGGQGPHECILLPDGTLAVANGSIELGRRLDPDGAEDPIAIAEMAPNLTYLDPASGEIIDQLDPPPELRRNSIRHLAVRPDGLLAFAMQWHGPSSEDPSLLGLHRRGQGAARLLSADGPAQRVLRGYAGSVAFSADGARVAISSPRGGVVDAFAVETGAHAARWTRPDICGLAPSGAGFAATTGLGEWLTLASATPDLTATTPGRAWDNHVAMIGA